MEQLQTSFISVLQTVWQAKFQLFVTNLPLSLLYHYHHSLQTAPPTVCYLSFHRTTYLPVRMHLKLMNQSHLFTQSNTLFVETGIALTKQPRE